MLERLFSPSSLAVIGVSRDKTKVGRAVFDNIRRAGFKGPCFPVNPQTSQIEGLKCYPTIKAIPHRVDLAIIVIPSKFVPQAVFECGEKGVKVVIILTAGFREVGPEGARREREILKIARKFKIRVLGPNVLGLIDTHSKLNVSFVKEMPPSGNIAFVSQSGALGTFLLDWAKEKKIGFSKFVSLGNKLDISEIDLLKVFSKDERTKVIAFYIEGINNGRAFLKESQRVFKKKPIIAIKAGTTTQGARVVSSHTGSLSGSLQCYRAAFRQGGIIQAETVEDLVDLINAFSLLPLAKRKEVAIVTNAGGPAILATDACGEYGLPLASFSSRTLNYLRKNLPSYANIYNPIDVLGDALEDRYALAIKGVLQDSNVGSLIVILTPQAMTQPEGTAKVIIELSKEFKKPIVSCFMGGGQVEKGIEILSKKGIPNYLTPERAVKVLKKLNEYTFYLKRRKKEFFHFEVEKERAKKIVEEKLEERILTGPLANELLEVYGIKTARMKLARTLIDAERIVDEIGYPVALKLFSPDILHKSDVGGVVLNISSDQELAQNYYELRFRAKKFFPEALIKGILVQEMVKKGREVIIGVNKDPQFGPLIMFGLGGIYVETFKDVSFGLAPLSLEDAKEMVEEVRSSDLLRGVRGERRADISAIIDTLLRVSQMVIDLPEILEMDINPLVVFEEGEGCKAIDVRISIGGEGK